jgi:hypothetical protein
MLVIFGQFCGCKRTRNRKWHKKYTLVKYNMICRKLVTPTVANICYAISRL